jgi:hypothetical protein
MTGAGAILAGWSALVIVLACVHRLRATAARWKPRPAAPGAETAAAAPRDEPAMTRWERDRRPGRTAVLLVVSAVSAWGWGATALRLMAPGSLPPLLQGLLALALGLGLQSHVFLLLGLAGRLRRGWVAATLALGAALAAVAPLPQVGVPAGAQEGWSATGVIAASFCAAVLALVVPACFTPPRSFDAHAYHLELPRRYALTGRLAYVPYMAHSPWPQAGQMLFVPAFLFRCAHFPQLVSALCGVVLAALVFETARLGAGLEGALLAVLILLGVTELVFQMTEPTVDVALGLFTMCALAAWACWFESREGSLLVLSGLFAGLACSTKMTALLLAGVLGGAGFAAGFFSGGVAAGLVAGSAVPVVALAVAAPWYARSAWLTGNPVFHFATRLFTTRNWAPSSEAAHRAIAEADGWGPVRGVRAWGRYAMRQLKSPAGWGPGLVALGPAALVLPLHAVTAMAGLASLALAIITLLLTDQIRLLLGAAGGLSAAAGAAAASLGGSLRGPWSATAAGLIGLLAWTGSFHALHHKLRAARGARRRASYLRKFLPYYDDYLWMNAHLPQDARVLLWTTRGFLLERDYVWLPPWQQGVLDFTRIRDAAAFHDEMKRHGITHVYYTDLEISRHLFGWLHDLHDGMVRLGLLAEDVRPGSGGRLYRVV